MSCTTFYQFAFFLQSLVENNSKSSYFYPKIVFIVSLYPWYFFLHIAIVHSEDIKEDIIVHSGHKKDNNSKLNFLVVLTKKFNFELCLFHVLHNIQLLMYSKESRRLFFCFMSIMFQATIEAPNIAIKNVFSIFERYFNRKFTSDCPVQHLWNRP